MPKIRIWTSREGSSTAVAWKSDENEVLLFSNLGFWMPVEVELSENETMEQAAEKVAARYNLFEEFPQQLDEMT